MTFSYIYGAPSICTQCIRYWKRCKDGVRILVSVKSPLGSSGPVSKGKVGIPCWRSPLEILSHWLSGITGHGGEVGGICKLEVPMQEKLKACPFPLQGNNGENSECLPGVCTSPQKTRGLQEA